jgi:hypothetical protein
MGIYWLTDRLGLKQFSVISVSKRFHTVVPVNFM